MPLRPDSLRPRHPLEICWQRLSTAEALAPFYTDTLAITYPLLEAQPAAVRGFAYHVLADAAEVRVVVSFRAYLAPCQIVDVTPVTQVFPFGQAAAPAAADYTTFYTALAACTAPTATATDYAAYIEHLRQLVPGHLRPAYRAYLPPALADQL